MTARDLAVRWRADAELLEQYGDEQLAHVCRQHADQLAAALSSQDDEPLDLAAASAESGYSSDRLRHMLTEGRVPNAGKRGAPRIRRGDLPRKRRPGARGFDAASLARDLVGGTDA